MTDWAESRAAVGRLKLAWRHYIEMRREAKFMRHFGAAVDSLPSGCPRTARALGVTLATFAEEIRARIGELGGQ